MSGAAVFLRGAATTHSGIRLAYAFPAAGRHEPDRLHWWVQDGEGWHLINLRDLCARAAVCLPSEFTHTYFDAAPRDWLEAAARTLALLTRLSPQHAPPPNARRWWLED